MKKNFIRALYESEIQNAELALATESISEELQSMVEKLTNIKIKELETLVKKIKYDGDLEKADSFKSSIGEKLDQITSAIADAKDEIDNEVVKLFNGESLEGNSDLDSEMSDLDADFGEDMGGMDEMDGTEDFSDEDFDIEGFDEITREIK